MKKLLSIICCAVMAISIFTACEKEESTSTNKSRNDSNSSKRDSLSSCDDNSSDTDPANVFAEKPVIYLYPTEKADVSVNLDYNGRLTCTYPSIDNGWNVTAYPDGRIINKADGRKYSYLYWEGESKTQYDFSKGFVVKGEDTAAFLQEKLAYMGLTPKEYNEFIVYWLPLMQDNKYNLITFQGEAYTDSAKLNITPKPDSMLRVFMAYKPLDSYVQIEEQKLNTFERKGFAVVEWGGTCVE